MSHTPIRLLRAEIVDLEPAGPRPTNALEAKLWSRLAFKRRGQTVVSGVAPFVLSPAETAALFALVEQSRLVVHVRREQAGQAPRLEKWWAPFGEIRVDSLDDEPSGHTFAFAVHASGQAELPVYRCEWCGDAKNPVFMGGSRHDPCPSRPAGF